MKNLIERQAVEEWLAKWEGYISKDIIARMQCRVIDIPLAQPRMLTETERLICKMYLDDKDKYKTCNEYKILQGLLDGDIAPIEPSAQLDVPDTNVGDMVSRCFVELLAEYHDPELCTYKEYKGKPYFSIKYIENGEGYIGYGTYSPKVLSQYLREYFMATAQPEQQWIPCSERLPEDEYVLISKKPSKISGSKWSVAIAIRTADPRSRKIQWRDSGFGVIQDDKVLAWMPLPEPYQEGEQDEGD